MPRTSARQPAIHKLTAVIKARSRLAKLRILFRDKDEFEDDLDGYYLSKLAGIRASRHLARSPTYRRRDDR